MGDPIDFLMFKKNELKMKNKKYWQNACFASLLCAFVQNAMAAPLLSDVIVNNIDVVVKNTSTGEKMQFVDGKSDIQFDANSQLVFAGATWTVLARDSGTMGATFSLNNTANMALIDMTTGFNLMHHDWWGAGAPYDFDVGLMRTTTDNGMASPLSFRTTQPTLYALSSMTNVWNSYNDPVSIMDAWGILQNDSRYIGQSSVNVASSRSSSSNGGMYVTQFGMLEANTTYYFTGEISSNLSGMAGVQLLLASANVSATQESPLMPVSSRNNGYDFLFNNVSSSSLVYVDPLVATGYDYFADSGQTFTSVLLPSIGDGLYSLSLWNGTAWVYKSSLQAGFKYDFDIAVDRFRIEGIEVSAGLDPNDPSAFVTGLTFNNIGASSMHMTPIVGSAPDVAVPEPSMLALLFSGMLAAGLGRHGKSKNR